MRPLIEKRLLPVLAVEVDELPPERLQGGHGGQLVVDEHPAPPLRGDLAPENDLAPVIGVEHGLHDGLVFTGAYQLGGRPPPDEQMQRAEHDRLAGARLAGEHGEAGAELDVDPLDDRKIPDAEIPNHSHSPRRW